MSYILDTCVLSETIKVEPNPGVLSWLRQQYQDKLFITCFSLGELRKGIDRLPASSKKHQLLLWLTKLTDSYADRFLDFDRESAIIWGALCAELESCGHPIPIIDGLIAACTLRHGFTLVTRNENDYRHSAVPMLNPWSDGI